MGANWPDHWNGHWALKLPDPHYPCHKRKFPNKQMAKAAIRQIRSEIKDWERKAFKPTAYKCDNCGLWHWGHDRSRPRRGYDERYTGSDSGAA